MSLVPDRRAAVPEIVGPVDHDPTLKDRVEADTLAAARLLSWAYGALSEVKKYGDWDDRNYYPNASDCYEAIAEFLYPDA